MLVSELYHFPLLLLMQFDSFHTQRFEEKGKMEALGSVWSYQENIDELKNMLLYTTIELETVKNEAREQIRKHEESINQLLQLFKVACQERDEARDQLHKLFDKLIPSSSNHICPILPTPQPETPPVYPIKGNTSFTESDSLSETYNHHSYGSSHVDSYLGVVTSPDLSHINMADSNTFVPEYNRSSSMNVITEPDRATAVIDNLVKGKTLPEKGKLLQTVMEAGPLLQTLLVSGPLPRWRNPPPLQPFQLPPFSVNSFNTEKLNNHKLVSNMNYPIHNSLGSCYVELPYGSSQMYSPSTLNFISGAGPTSLPKRKVSNVGVSGDFVQNSVLAGKRQRCQ